MDSPEQHDDRLAALQHLGATLREAREQQDLSLSALAAQLHMGEGQIQALEAADLSKLPEPVFVIAQARRVADALGTDVSLVLAQLKKATSFDPLPAATERRDRSSAPMQRSLPWRLVGMALLVAGLAGTGLWGWQQRRRPAVARKPPAPVQPQKPLTTSSSPTTLRLNSREPSWLEVQNQRGQVLFQGTLKGERRFALNGGLRVKAGRPDLVLASLGQQPGQALGPIEQIRWVSFPAPAASTPPKAP